MESQSKRGRPPKYKEPEDLQIKIDEYLNDTANPTITGLVLHCGFADRHSFYEYEKKPEFSYTIKKARTRMEQWYESNLFENTAGSIFALKNFGWRDRIDIDAKVDTYIKLVHPDDDMMDKI
jgi:hypothetical protein